MADPKTSLTPLQEAEFLPTRSPWTWRASVSLQSIPFTGTKEQCEVWTKTMMGCPVVVIDMQGHQHVVGIVQAVGSEAIR